MTRPREGGHTIQHQGGHLKKALRNPNSTLFEKMQNQTTHRPQRETRRKTSWETSWETRRKGERQEGRETLKGRQNRGKADAPFNTGTHVGKQWRTRRDKTLGRGAHHPTQAHVWGDNGRQGGTRRRETNPLGRRTHHPTQTHIVRRQWEVRGDEGRQGETRPREGVYAVQHRQAGQDPTQHRHTCGETMENIGRQGPRKGGRTIYNGQQRETRPSERRTHHPTRGNKKGHSIQQRGKRKDTIADKRRQDPAGKGGDTIQQRETRRGTMGDKGRIQQRKQERVQWETKGDKSLGKADGSSA